MRLRSSPPAARDGTSLHGIVTPPVSAVKGSDPPSHIADVIRRLRTIEASGSRSDGVVCFARLYREVTEGVGVELTRQGFADNRFLETLDVHFAGMFFSALESYDRDPGGTPSAWVPLFAQRSRRGIAPLQFALAGMNAHINRDLPVAVVETCTRLGTAPPRRPHHDDYIKVNAVLAALEPNIRLSFEDGILDDVDRGLGPVDNVIAHWSIDEARNAAWTNALVLWSLRRVGTVQRAYLDTLDGTVGMAGRGLLIAVL